LKLNHNPSTILIAELKLVKFIWTICFRLWDGRACKSNIVARPDIARINGGCPVTISGCPGRPGPGFVPLNTPEVGSGA
jgi:hypothetical protein